VELNGTGEKLQPKGINSGKKNAGEEMSPTRRRD